MAEGASKNLSTWDISCIKWQKAEIYVDTHKAFVVSSGGQIISRDTGHFYCVLKISRELRATVMVSNLAPALLDD